jgi:hypothetical protein
MREAFGVGLVQDFQGDAGGGRSSVMPPCTPATTGSVRAAQVALLSTASR